MKVKVKITLTIDEYTEDAKEVQVEIEEFLPDGFQNLDQWEQDVRRVGFQSMRKLFRYGIELYEETVLSRYTHKSNNCHLVKRDLREFTYKTALGKVTFLRHRMYWGTVRRKDSVIIYIARDIKWMQRDTMGIEKSPMTNIL